MELKHFESEADLLETMDDMTIGPLRIFAKQWGVIPGTKKRQELIDGVIRIYRGAQPEPPKKRGRPAKSIREYDFDEDEIYSLAQKTANAGKKLPFGAEYPVEEGHFLCKGTLGVMADGYGFVRNRGQYEDRDQRDVYVPAAFIKHYGLRPGDVIKCEARETPAKAALSLVKVFELNEAVFDESIVRVPFEKLEPCYPNQRLTLEYAKTDYALRAIDLVAPIGKGQRGLIVAPPKTGKTVLLKMIAQAITCNHPEVKLFVLLIDERPEEVTDFKKTLNCDIFYSNFDRSAEHHIRIAEKVITHAKALVEQGQDVMILIDSITRLARAYNQVMDSSGRTLTGGLDIQALQEPKKLFGAGRNISDGGSLTIIATALIDTGSKMDDLIYEEFKSTGNMEIHLDRRMSEKRIFPAIDLNRSSTRHEELLLTDEQRVAMYLIRNMLSEDPVEATRQLLDILTMTANNNEFIETVKRIYNNSYRNNSK